MSKVKTYGKQMPSSEARPLGTKRASNSPLKIVTKRVKPRPVGEYIIEAVPEQKDVDTPIMHYRLNGKTACEANAPSNPMTQWEEVTCSSCLAKRHPKVNETPSEVPWASVTSEQFQEMIAESQKDVDTPPAPVVDSFHQPTIPSAHVSGAAIMILTYVKTSKNGKRAIYSGAANSLVFPLTAFPDKTAPASIELVGDVFAVKAVKVAKVKLTKEERAALPKPTLAEKIAKREASLARDKAKLVAASNM